MSENSGYRTFTAGEALAGYRRVKIKPATSATPPEVVYADAGEQHIGVTQQAVASGAAVAVRLRTVPGTCEMTAAEAFAVGAVLYGADDGKVQDTSAGSAIGQAVEAATADGDIVECAEFGVLSTTAATVSVEDAGSVFAATTVEGVLDELEARVTALE
jgi:hypothetical protein